MRLITVIFFCTTHVVISDLSLNSKDVGNVFSGISFDTEKVQDHRKESEAARNPRWAAVKPIDLVNSTLFPTLQHGHRRPRQVQAEGFPDCSLIKVKNRRAQSGVYMLYRRNGKGSFKAWCDMDRDGGGWTLILKRGKYDFKENFFRKWDEYKSGFGNAEEEYWLGLDIIHELTDEEPQSLRVDLQDSDNNDWRNAKYANFHVGPERDGYKLTVTHYSGTAGDSLWVHNTHKFATRDFGSTAYFSTCANTHKSAWWFAYCIHSNLNGLNIRGNHPLTYGDGINWGGWRGFHHSLQVAEMKIRPRNFF